MRGCLISQGGELGIINFAGFSALSVLIAFSDEFYLMVNAQVAEVLSLPEFEFDFSMPIEFF